MIEDETYHWSGAFSELNPNEQRSVARLVREGGAVEGTEAIIIGRLKRTRKLALLRIKATDRIIGVAALKNPTSSYRAKTFAAAGVPIGGRETALELGYVVIAEDMKRKRFSGGLVDAIAKEIREFTFATTDSNTMRNNLRRSGFAKAGKEWQGKKGKLTFWTYNLLSK